MIYFISDTHFHHSNIIKYCNIPFKDINEMNETIISNWNSIITKDDVLYHLGDFCLSNDDEIKNIFNRLNGNKILIRGNHDRKPVKFYENIGFGEIGFENLINVIYNKRLENIPKILETPYIEEFPPYKLEIEMIRNKKFNDKLKEEVIKIGSDKDE